MSSKADFQEKVLGIVELTPRSTEQERIQISELKNKTGTTKFDFRIFFKKDNNWFPTQRGFSLLPEEQKHLKELLNL